jgi:DNA-binding NtrC family response regulator
LKRAGFEVGVSYLAEEGLELAFDTLPDVIVCDVAMPRMNGLEILRWLKAHAATAEIPVVLTSGHRSFDCSGAFTFLAKPFDAAGLITAVRNALSNGHEGKRCAELAA